MTNLDSTNVGADARTGEVWSCSVIQRERRMGIIRSVGPKVRLCTQVSASKYAWQVHMASNSLRHDV